MIPLSLMWIAMLMHGQAAPIGYFQFSFPSPAPTFESVMKEHRIFAADCMINGITCAEADKFWHAQCDHETSPSCFCGTDTCSHGSGTVYGPRSHCVADQHATRFIDCTEAEKEIIKNSLLQDVPAVQRTRCKPDTHGVTGFYDPKEDYPAKACTTKWTCTDHRRVMLTDESGKRHCILFGGGQWNS